MGDRRHLQNKVCLFAYFALARVRRNTLYFVLLPAEATELRAKVDLVAGTFYGSDASLDVQDMYRYR